MNIIMQFPCKIMLKVHFCELYLKINQTTEEEKTARESLGEHWEHFVGNVVALGQSSPPLVHLSCDWNSRQSPSLFGQTGQGSVTHASGSTELIFGDKSADRPCARAGAAIFIVEEMCYC